MKSRNLDQQKKVTDNLMNKKSKEMSEQLNHKTNPITMKIKTDGT